MKYIFLLIILYTQFNSSLAQQVADDEFVSNYVIDSPKHNSGEGPIVMIDGAHNNFHTLSGRFSPFAKMLEKDGYVLKSNDSPITPEVLSHCRIYVISNALNDTNTRGRWYLPTPSAFTIEEMAAIRDWVNDGGRLFLIADHMPFPGAAEELAAHFRFGFTNGFEIGSQFPTVFRKSDGTLSESPVTEGIDSVVSFTGQAFIVPSDDASVMTFGPGHMNLFADTAWQFNENTDTTSAEGMTQGAIMDYGNGKLAIFGEAAMFTAQTGNGQKFGFNSPLAPQNVQFLLNIIHWLEE